MSYDPTARCEVSPVFLGDGRLLLESQDDPAGTVRSAARRPGRRQRTGPADRPRLRHERTREEGRHWELSPDRGTVLFLTDGWRHGADLGGDRRGPTGRRPDHDRRLELAAHPGDALTRHSGSLKVASGRAPGRGAGPGHHVPTARTRPSCRAGLRPRRGPLAARGPCRPTPPRPCCCRRPRSRPTSATRRAAR